MPTVHGMSLSGNCYKACLLLNQLGRPCAWIETDTTPGQTRTPEFLSLNSAGKVPLPVCEDGQVSSESGAILFWLAGSTPCLPDDPWQRAQTLRWMFFEQYSHEPHVAAARFIRRFLPAGHAREAELPAPAETWRGCTVRDGAASVRAPTVHWRCDAYGIADIALFAHTHCADEAGFDLARYPAIAGWLGRMTGTAGFVPMRAAGD